MAIREDALNAFFRTKPEQQRLATALDEAFDVTYGSYQFGQAFWLCQPKQFVAERFGIQREVVAVYSPHARADARLLTSLENISRAPEFRHRVDNVVALVVYEGDKAAVEELAIQSKDWVIIPLSASELADRGAQAFLIRSRMAAIIGRFDLFGMTSPIKHDKYFYGRDAIVQELVQRALVRKEQSGLFGLRKTGKTSVLFAIQRRICEKGAVAEYVDCQSPGIYGSRWWAVLEELCRRMLGAAEKGGCPAPAEFSFNASDAANSFIRTVKWIQDRSAVGQIVLLLDEVEFITPGIANHLGQHWDDDHLPLWQTIRSASQETKGFLTFCVAGVNPSSVEQPHFGQIPNPERPGTSLTLWTGSIPALLRFFFSRFRRCSGSRARGGAKRWNRPARSIAPKSRPQKRTMWPPRSCSAIPTVSRANASPMKTCSPRHLMVPSLRTRRTS